MICETKKLFVGILKITFTVDLQKFFSIFMKKRQITEEEEKK